MSPPQSIHLHTQVFILIGQCILRLKEAQYSCSRAKREISIQMLCIFLLQQFITLMDKRWMIDSEIFKKIFSLFKHGMILF